MKIRMLGEVALRVNNLGPMIEFYENVVGLELMRREDSFAFFRINEGYGGHTQVLALFDRRGSGNSYLPPEAGRTSVDHIAFTIDKSDFDAEDSRLKSLGLEISYAYHDWVQWRSLYISDPEGNMVELVCYDPTAGNSNE